MALVQVVPQDFETTEGEGPTGHSGEERSVAPVEGVCHEGDPDFFLVLVDEAGGVGGLVGEERRDLAAWVVVVFLSLMNR